MARRKGGNVDQTTIPSRLPDGRALAQAVTAPVSADLAAHLANLANPHATTAAQVGAPAVATFNAHAPRHANGGADELSVAGLSGLLADPQTPAAHASSHASAGSDPVAVTGLAGFPGGATTFLRADGAFAAPPGGGDVVGPAASVDGEVALFSGTTGKLLKRATATGPAKLAAGVLSASPIALASEVTGDLLLANLTPASAASKLLGRGSASGAGDYEEIALGSGLTMTGTTLSATGGGGTYPPTLQAEIVVTLASGSYNDYDPGAGWGTANVLAIVISGAGDVTLNGLVPGIASGTRIVVLRNATGAAHVVALVHENAGSLAANRFYLLNGATVSIPDRGVATLMYDGGVNSRWVVVGKSF